MNIAQVVISELIAMVGYALLGAAVYKLFQIGNHLSEIKALLERAGRNPATGQGTPLPSDSATEYAQNLLRAVSTESQRGN